MMNWHKWLLVNRITLHGKPRGNRKLQQALSCKPAEKLWNCSCQMPHATAVAATARLCKVLSRDLSPERESCWSWIWPWPKTLSQQCGRAAEASLRLRQIKLIKWELVKLACLWPLATFRCSAHTDTHTHRQIHTDTDSPAEPWPGRSRPSNRMLRLAAACNSSVCT